MKLTRSSDSVTFALIREDPTAKVERALKIKGTLTFSRVGEVGTGVTTFSERVSSGTYAYRVQAFSQDRASVSGYSNQIEVRVR